MIIIKIGGGAAINLDAITSDLRTLDEPYIIVHGANAVRDQLAEKLDLQRKTLTSITGFDSVYSDQDAIDLLMMAYAGLANKKLVAMCQKKGINAVGLSGVDGRVVTARRNSGIRVRENGKNRLVHDLSGKPSSINKPLLELLLNNSYVPVLCVPLIDEFGTAVNSENDDVVALLQRAFNADTVLHLIQAPGFLVGNSGNPSIATTMTSADVALALGTTGGRMKRKLLSISRLLESGTKRVVIADGRIDCPITRALAGEGTVIQ